MSPAGMIRVAAVLVALAAPATAHAAAGGGARLHAYAVTQRLALDGGQTGIYTLACRDRDVATDGTWRVDALDAAPQPGGTRFDLARAVDVLEVDTFSRGGYRFQLRNDAAGRAHVRLAVSCLEDRVGGRSLAVLDRREARTAVQPGVATAGTVACPAGTVAIAPGFRLAGGVARITDRYPALPRLRRDAVSVTALGPATITTSRRCLRRETTAAGGRRLRLRLAFRGANTDVADGRIETFTVSCREHESAIVGAWSLAGSWYLGEAPGGRRRSFKVLSPATGPAGNALLGLLCLRERASAAA